MFLSPLGVHLQRRRIPHGREIDSAKVTIRKVLVGLPYIKGLSKELRRTFRAYRVDSFLKYEYILCQHLWSQKDPAKKKTTRSTVKELARIVAAGVPTLGTLAGCSRLGSHTTGNLAQGPQKYCKIYTSRRDRSTRHP